MNMAKNGPKEEIDGKAVHIMSLCKGKEGKIDLEFDEKTLEKILMHSSVKDKKVAVLSVAGRYRQGKSFLLNLIIRFLTLFRFKKPDKWLDDNWPSDNLPIQGFPWKDGSKRDTTGIWIWNKPFFLNTEEGEVALFLVDTQGAFDGKSTHTECALFFALSTMLSSVQIYNIKSEIGEDNLDHLEFFTNYGKHFQSNSQHGKPFQDLIFLIRDWSHPSEQPFGEKGGRAILNDMLQEKDTLSDNQNILRKDLRSNFEKISCFLMPNPGQCVRERTVQKMSEMRKEFRDKVLEFCRFVFSDLKMKCKVINGEKLSCHKFFDYFKRYATMCNDGKMPTVESWFQTNMKLINEDVINTAKTEYKKLMEEECGESRKLSDEEMGNVHKNSLKKAIECFEKAIKMGDERTVEKYRKKLEEEIETKFNDFKKMNKLKFSITAVFNEMQKVYAENKATLGGVCTALFVYFAPYMFASAVVGASFVGIIRWMGSNFDRAKAIVSNVEYRAKILGLLIISVMLVYITFGIFGVLILMCLLGLLAKVFPVTNIF